MKGKTGSFGSSIALSDQTILYSVLSFHAFPPLPVVRRVGMAARLSSATPTRFADERFLESAVRPSDVWEDLSELTFVLFSPRSSARAPVGIATHLN